MALIIPNTFGAKTSAQLSDLDENFTYLKSELDPYIDNILVAESGEVTIDGGVVSNIIGDVTGNLTGNVTGNVDGNISGTATLEGNSTLTTGATLSSAEMGSIYAPGMVIQVVQNHIDTPLVQATTLNVLAAIAGVTATITPKFANSKILVMVRWFGETSPTGNTWDSMFGLLRNGTAVGSPGASSTPATRAIGITISSLSYYVGDANSTPETMSFQYLDSPATTSAVTYQLSYVADTTGTLYTNRTVGDVDSTAGYERGTSSVILMEIAG